MMVFGTLLWIVSAALSNCACVTQSAHFSRREFSMRNTKSSAVWAAHGRVIASWLMDLAFPKRGM